MKIVATIEARMSSSRLPGKVLLPVLNQPLLRHQIERLSQVNSLDEIVVATTTNSVDDVIENLAVDCGVKFFRGSELDVMQRVADAGEFANADIIVETTGLPYFCLLQCLRAYFANKNAPFLCLLFSF